MSLSSDAAKLYKYQITINIILHFLHTVNDIMILETFAMAVTLGQMQNERLVYGLNLRTYAHGNHANNISSMKIDISIIH